MPSSAGRGLVRRRATAFGTLAVIGAAAWLFLRDRSSDVRHPDQPPTQSPPAPAFLNTGSEARFVGSDACRPCHEAAFASFARTGMGRSMASVVPDGTPPGAAFDHPPSNRRYQVYRAGVQVWHRESILASSGAEVALGEYPLRWVIGSGRHWQTYLTEVDGFLVESPVSWYPGRLAWGMSPGYDRPEQMGFARGVGEGCLTCHGGRADALDGSLHRMRIHEPAIGCERCHGPGSLHVEHWRDPNRGGGGHEEADLTIVNPAHLPRDLADAVCEQCHLNSDARITAPGKALTDFRPGLPLQDVRLDYHLDIPNTPMKVVGHADQMHRSRCYQESRDLSCTSCHDPHGMPRPEARGAYYRAACLTCHAPAACRVTPEQLRSESPDNNCVTCHMPAARVDVPHVAFTHHRIGIHAGPAQAIAEVPPRSAGVLRPFHDLSRLSERDRQRSLGIAYAETAVKQRDPALAAVYNDRAVELLWPLAGQDQRDARLDYVLFLLSARRNPGAATPRLETALSHPDLPVQLRCDGLQSLARTRAAAGRYGEAVDLLHQLTRLRRQADDWLLLGQYEQARNQPAQAVEALEKAVRINTWLPDVHRSLMQFYLRQGDRERAAWHQVRAGIR
jgi:hypothetical protein